MNPLMQPGVWDVLATSGLSIARETGVLSVLPIAATYRASLHVHAGDFGAASALIEEANAITQATETAPLKYAALMLAAWRGNEADGLELIEAAKVEAVARGEGMGLGLFLTRALVEQLGGSFQITSRPGDGTDACIDLPAAEAAERSGT